MNGSSPALKLKSTHTNSGQRFPQGILSLTCSGSSTYIIYLLERGAHIFPSLAQPPWTVVPFAGPHCLPTRKKAECHDLNVSCWGALSSTGALTWPHPRRGLSQPPWGQPSQEVPGRGQVRKQSSSIWCSRHSYQFIRKLLMCTFLCGHPELLVN
jgi:hypothetical protein